MDKNVIPSIIAFGATGSGKSYLLKIISGGDKDFKVGESIQSETSEYFSKEIFPFGNKNRDKVLVYDTVGFNDNRVSDGAILEKLSDLLIKVHNGLSIILLVLPITNTRLDIGAFEDIIGIMGSRITSAKGFLIVFNQGDRLNENEKTKAIDKYIQQTKEVVSNFGISISENNYFLFENGKENALEEKLLYLLSSELYVPTTSTLIIETRKKMTESNNENSDKESSVNENALIESAKLIPELGKYVKKQVENSEKNVEKYKLLYEKNPDNKIFKNKYENAIDVNIRLITGVSATVILGSKMAIEGSKLVGKVFLQKSITEATKNVAKFISGQSPKIAESIMNLNLVQCLSLLKETLKKMQEIKIVTEGVVKTSKKAINAIPLIGIGVGIGFGIYRFCKGEILKGFAEIAAGSLSIIPCVGTALSIAASAGIGGWDYYDTLEE